MPVVKILEMNQKQTFVEFDRLVRGMEAPAESDGCTGKGSLAHPGIKVHMFALRENRQRFAEVRFHRPDMTQLQTNAGERSRLRRFGESSQILVLRGIGHDELVDIHYETGRIILKQRRVHE